MTGDATEAKPTPATTAPTMPRGNWLWPDDRTGMEWADEHDERL